MSHKILSTKTSLILFFVLLITSVSVFAQRSGSGRWSAGAIVLMGSGSMGNGLTDAEDRSMLYTPVGLFLGFNMKRFRLGLNYEYMVVGQSTDPAEVDGTNLGGSGSSAGVRLEYYDGKQSFGAVYRLSNTYNLDKSTFAGETATYKATGGFSVQYTRQIKNKVGFVIDYTTEEFSESLTTGNVSWSRVGLGLIFSNFSGSRR